MQFHAYCNVIMEMYKTNFYKISLFYVVEGLTRWFLPYLLVAPPLVVDPRLDNIEQLLKPKRPTRN